MCEILRECRKVEIVNHERPTTADGRRPPLAQFGHEVFGGQRTDERRTTVTRYNGRRTRVYTRQHESIDTDLNTAYRRIVRYRQQRRFNHEV